MVSRIFSRQIELQNPRNSIIATLPGVQGEAKADVWRVKLTDNGAPANLTDWTAQMQFVRTDGTIQVPATITGNVIEATFPQAAYVYVAKCKAFLWLINAATGTERVVDELDLEVVKGSVGNVIDPGTVVAVPTLNQLLAQLEAAELATTAANTAAGSANTAAMNANAAAGEVDAAIAAIPGAVADAVGNSQDYRKTRGNPARFFPVPASALAVKALLTAYQAGSGDPSPTNIRAIFPAVEAGGTVKAKRTGKNLFDKTAIESGYYINASGAVLAAGAWGLSPYIRCTPGT